MLKAVSEQTTSPSFTKLTIISSQEKNTVFVHELMFEELYWIPS